MADTDTGRDMGHRDVDTDMDIDMNRDVDTDTGSELVKIF